MNFMPRIQGKIGIIEEGPPDLVGKYFFEIWFSVTNDQSFKKESMGVWAPFDSSEAAKVALEQAVVRAGKALQKQFDGGEKENCFDMKTGTVRRWSEFGKVRPVKGEEK